MNGSGLKFVIFHLFRTAADSSRRFSGRAALTSGAGVSAISVSVFENSGTWAGFDSGCQHRQHRSHLADRAKGVAGSWKIILIFKHFDLITFKYFNILI
jgi:hypothetical protein